MLLNDSWPSTLSVLYEDDHVLAVDKAPGVVVHPAYRHIGDTLADVVFSRQHACDGTRPWLMHRLDKDTSGIVLFAKSIEALRAIALQFTRHTAIKRYVAVTGNVPAWSDLTIETPLARSADDRRVVVPAAHGQPAVTHVRVLARTCGGTILLVQPQTGRMHQIRAHLAQHGCPVQGDVLYGAPDATPGRLMLHAWQLEVWYPGSIGPQVFEAPIPMEFPLSTEDLAHTADIESVNSQS